jgi:hypothetical protein
MERNAAPAGRPCTPEPGRLRDPARPALRRVREGHRWTGTGHFPRPRKRGPGDGNRRGGAPGGGAPFAKGAAPAKAQKVGRRSALRPPRISRGKKDDGEPRAEQTTGAAKRSLRSEERFEHEIRGKRFGGRHTAGRQILPLSQYRGDRTRGGVGHRWIPRRGRRRTSQQWPRTTCLYRSIAGRVQQPQGRET